MGSKEEAIKLIDDVRKMSQDGGFHWTKFVCNNSDVLATIPKEEQQECMKKKEISNKQTGEKALGIHWNISEDVLGFNVNFKDKSNTRRGFLSMLSSIYDPLGLVAPFILEGRRIASRKI
mgnify:CR=1 FL=1